MIHNSSWQTKWNTKKRIQGCKKFGLTDKNINNAKKFGKALENTEFSKAYSIPLGRTIDISNHILGDKNIEIVTVDYLKEINLGA
ncbi:histidine phosphatase family protein [Clostridium faecium]|uniref:Histidine phosphatase family protein n=1 Tax=Clostridium faecium TaxID=2762223 RepID=A0ABR8YTF2_9CLOT|nr:histidine phosphatase family protein [Clostridium faecium]